MSSRYISRNRRQQTSSGSGLGAYIPSPKKRHNPKYKTRTLSISNAKQAALKSQLAEKLLMLKRQSDDLEPLDDKSEGWEDIPQDEQPSIDEQIYDNCDQEGETSSSLVKRTISDDSNNGQDKTSHKKRRTEPDKADINFHAKWQSLIPRLTSHYLQYQSKTVGKPVQQSSGNRFLRTCETGQCHRNCSTEILCLYWGNFQRIQVESCSCQTVPEVLLGHGLFPTSPDQIRVAISIELLDFYSCLFAQSCDAVNAFAAALNSFYTSRGYYLLNKKGDKYKEPFRKGFNTASQWFDELKVYVEKQVDKALDNADKLLQAHIEPEEHRNTESKVGQVNPAASLTSLAPPVASHSLPQVPQTSMPPMTEAGKSQPIPEQMPKLAQPETPPLRECHRMLRQLCPTCFGGQSFGKPLDEGCDFQVATDGNFHHRHLISAGKSIPFHTPKHIIPKSFVDQVGDHIEKARKQKPRERQSKVPDSAIDECQSSYHAANGDKKKADGKRYDEQGWMSLVCRHDVPLFFASIDTPGEQQKYAVALLLWFYQFVPPESTIACLYDVGCVLHRSVELFDILPQQLVSKLFFVTTAMHAYGHQWSCQLEYNPQLCRGLGLTDGEGVERVWSRLRKLIPLVRSSSGARRLWITDRQLSAIALDIKDDLGDWILRRQRRGIMNHLQKARESVAQSGMTIEELRKQWDLQKAAQMSVRAHAPVRLKKELDSILSLQTQLGTVEKAIQATQELLTSTNTVKDAERILEGLKKTHTTLADNVERLYSSLNIPDTHPDLGDVNISFVRILLLARDLKINIRKRAIGSFFEWDRLDRAVGGKDQPLGVYTLTGLSLAITRRTPALITAIKKFNTYCQRLEAFYEPSWNIPLPAPLPVKLEELRDPNKSTLMEDVWISKEDSRPQPWLHDAAVRAGIRGMIKLDRCTEEQRRLGIEADNLCRWFGRELAATELALRLPINKELLVPLTKQRDHMLHLKTRWSTHLASNLRFDSHVETATTLADAYIGEGAPAPIKWKQIIIQVEAEEHQDQTDDDEDITVTSSSAQDVYDDAITGGVDMNDESSIMDLAEVLEDEQMKSPAHDTSEVSYVDNVISLHWNQPAMFCPDQTLKMYIDETVFVPLRKGDLSSRKQWTIGCYQFQQREMTILGQSISRKCLNDVCINGLSTLLKEIFCRDIRYSLSSNQCALFTTHDLVRVRYKGSDHDVWRNISHTSYWSKNVWILPIHRSQEGHWVLAVFYVARGEIHLFDSLAGRRGWIQDVRDIAVFILRLRALASLKGHQSSHIASEAWTARPVTISAVQTNGYDCGLWVLLWIAMVLRGCDTVEGVTEESISNWRALLGGLVRTHGKLERY